VGAAEGVRLVTACFLPDTPNRGAYELSITTEQLPGNGQLVVRTG